MNISTLTNELKKIEEIDKGREDKIEKIDHEFEELEGDMVHLLKDIKHHRSTP